MNSTVKRVEQKWYGTRILDRIAKAVPDLLDKEEATKESSRKIQDILGLGNAFYTRNPF